MIMVRKTCGKNEEKVCCTATCGKHKKVARYVNIVWDNEDKASRICGQNEDKGREREL